jgi:hypothetical protein
MTILLSPGFHVRGYAMRSYQIRAAHKIFTGTPVRNKHTGAYEGPERDGTAVHIDMGLGKTVIALTAIVDCFKFAVFHRPCLIVAPIKVCETVWRQEAANWSHTKHLRFELVRGNEKQRAFAVANAFDVRSNTRKKDVLLINPELIPWLEKFIREDWSTFDGLIIDDVSWKDPRSKQFRAISRYGRRDTIKGADGKSVRDGTGHTIRIPAHRFKRAAKLTGTPSTTGLHNLWAPMYLMDHGARIHSDYDTFEGRFFHKTREVADHVWDIEINKEEAESRPAWQVRDGAPERIHELIADITIELDAADYGVLPKTLGDASKGEPPPTHLHRVELPDELRARYDVLERDAVLELEKDVVMAQNGGAKSMMCWQIANGAIYKTDEFGQQSVEELHSAKLDKLVELIDTLGTNCIIPYYFKHDYARIVQRLAKEGIGFSSFKRNNAERIVDDFSAGKIQNLLLHPWSAAHGLDRLQFGAHTLIWFTSTWSLEKYLQTNARLARSGQDNIVGIHNIITSRTTDELMLINLRQNGDTQTKFRAAIREYQAIRGISYV